jgi:hypothetical protein
MLMNANTPNQAHDLLETDPGSAFVEAMSELQNLPRGTGDANMPALERAAQSLEIAYLRDPMIGWVYSARESRGKSEIVRRFALIPNRMSAGAAWNTDSLGMIAGDLHRLPGALGSMLGWFAARGYGLAPVREMPVRSSRLTLAQLLELALGEYGWAGDRRPIESDAVKSAFKEFVDRLVKNAG